MRPTTPYGYRSGDGVPVAQPLFQEAGSGSTPTSPLQFHFHRIAVEEAAVLNALWHSRLPHFPLRTARKAWAFVAEYEGRFYATAIWTPPVARLLNGKGWIELRRFAISPQAPKNTASRMLGWMVRELRRLEPWIGRFISYQDIEVHTGTIYKAAGWRQAENYVCRTRTWTGWRNRPRRKEQGIAARMRWEMDVYQGGGE